MTSIPIGKKKSDQAAMDMNLGSWSAKGRTKASGAAPGFPTENHHVYRPGIYHKILAGIYLIKFDFYGKTYIYAYYGKWM